MNWLNIDAFLQGGDQSHGNQQQNNSQLQNKKPQPRWGQACVTAHNKIYIIGGYEGQYLGDVWSFDFNTLSFSELKLEGENIQALSRSNHTAVFYQKHNAIYVFGGGQAQKQRFNDTLKLDLEDLMRRPTQKDLKLSKVNYQQDSLVPVARTYHASCLMRKYMVIIGGEATSDLKDFWALDLDEMKWCKPDISGFDNYTSKRFHTATSISDNKLITFGGCHSEYAHMNEMHIFDLTQFYQNPTSQLATIVCTKVLVNEGVPSTRWGHSASTYNGKLYILGGRNEQDIIDLHEFDPEQPKWRSIEITGQLPKARRRHSCLFVSGSLIMFGGFDGNFYNDLNILDFSKPNKQIIQIQQSSIDQDYSCLVNNEENADLCFLLNNSTQTKIYAHKALLLFRAIEKEMQVDLTEDATFYQLVQDQRVPDFIVTIYYSKKGDTITLPDIHCKNSFAKFLEFLYCDKFIENMTTTQVRAVSEITKALNLTNITSQLKRRIEGAKIRIHQQIMAELQARQPNEGLQLNRQQQKQVKQKVETLESQLKLDFTQFDEYQIQSPEDKYDRQHQKAASLMNQCKNLDEFYDIVFLVDETLIKANSLVLMVRCPYFKSMLSTKYSFKELGMRQSGQIKVQGVPKSYFTNIIQYIYSDHFYIQRNEAEFFIRLLIYADYFMLPRLVDICSSYLKPFITVKTVLKILLVAHAHNAEQLENFCITFITQNEQEVLDSRSWRSLKRQAQESLLQYFLKKIREEKEESFVQICLQQYVNRIQKNSNETYGTNQTKRQNEIGPKTRQKSNTSSSRESNLSSSQMSQISGNRPVSIKDEELDLDEIFNTANYIYLEEHNKFESYNLDINEQSQQQKSFISALPKINEEEKELNKHYLSSDEYNDYEDKENISILSNIIKYNSGIQPINSIPISSKNKLITNKKVPLLKKRDIKRMPLQSLENDQSDYKEQSLLQPSFKRGADFEAESNQAQERVSTSQINSTQQTQQNCYIFQTR